MAPTIGRLALDNGFHGSIPEDWVALPPQNIQHFLLDMIGSFTEERGGMHVCFGYGEIRN